MHPLRPEHVGRVAELHRECLGGLLTRLGTPALRTFYSGTCRSPLTIGFVHGDESVDGFVFGSTDTARQWRELLRGSPIKTTLSVLGGVLRSPSAVGSLWQSVFARKPDVPDLGTAQLAYIAVAPEARRRGIARELVVAFDREIAERGLDAYELSVVSDNRAAVSFYRSLDFEIGGEYDEFGERYLRLKRSLARQTPDR